MSSRALAQALRRDSRSRSALLVVGAGPGCDALAERIGMSDVLGVISRDGTSPNGWPYLGSMGTLAEVLDAGGVDEVALCLDATQLEHIDALIETCLDRGVKVSIPVPTEVGQRPVPLSLSGTAGKVKRLIDVVGASLGLVVAAPILAALAVAILATDGRPAVFKQRRAGLMGRPFHIVKFRTMERGADARRRELRQANEVNKGAFKMNRDPRVTRLGRWIRRTSLDELPQLWNVLKGEMSLVGPRPHPYDDIAGYELWHLRRLAVKPGLTGLWQIELRGDGDFDRWVARDVEYIERWSLRLDLGVILRTIPAVLRGTGR